MKAPSYKTKTKKILIVDDDADLTRMIQFLLEKRDFNVLTSNDGEEGLKQVNLYKPDLILLDLNMPKIGGIEFCHKVRDGQEGVDPAIIILTARANIEPTLRDMNVNGLLTKPFEISQLLEEIDRVFQDRGID